MTPPRTCLITGATGGLGRALAHAFSAAEYRVVLSARGAGALRELERELPAGGCAGAIVADLAEPDAVRRLGDELEALVGRLDVAIANAGQATGGSFLSPAEPLERWRDMVLANVHGTAATARALLPLLVRAQGSLVLIGSVTAHTVRPGDLYSATKRAVAAIGEAIRLESEALGVHVCVVHPALIDTPLVTGARRASPLLRPADVAEEVVRLVRPGRGMDVTEVVLRPRPATGGAP